MTVGGWLLAGKAHIDHDRVLAGGAVHPLAGLLQGQPVAGSSSFEHVRGSGSLARWQYRFARYGHHRNFVLLDGARRPVAGVEHLAVVAHGEGLTTD
jgi:hypothetical protein